ncbi:MAG: NERD domain-containing protein [Clostridia bacterium]|nr:NERD domain-containing protein [Clostridia bacterium]
MHLVIFLIFLAGIFFLFRWRVGQFKGEEPFEAYLEQLMAHGSVIEDVMLDNQTLAPYLFVSTRGIFNIYYNSEILGRVYGDEEDVSWYQVLEHRKLSMPNPVRRMEKQRREFEKIGEYLEMEIPVYEVICLSKRAVAKLNIGVPIVPLKEFVAYVIDKPSVLSAEAVEKIKESLAE